MSNLPEKMKAIVRTHLATTGLRWWTLPEPERAR